MCGGTRRAGWLGLLVLLAGVRPAVAQVASPETPSTLGDADEWSSTPRSRATNQVTMREGIWTLGGSLSFLTAETPPAEDVGRDILRFTDVVLLNLGGRYSFGSVEVFGSTSVLPKKPTDTDALFWQGARAGVRWAFVDHFALSFRGAGGPMLGDSGWWSAGDLQLEARATVHSTITFMGKFGASANGLFDDGAAGTDSLFFSEVLVGGEIILHAAGWAAFWVGADFNLPVWDAADDSGDSALSFEPQTRANVHLGAVLSYVEDWDLYAEYAIVDRGEAEVPASRLPLLDSGFDQQQLVIGVVHYFEPPAHTPEDDRPVDEGW